MNCLFIDPSYSPLFTWVRLTYRFNWIVCFSFHWALVFIRFHWTFLQKIYGSLVALPWFVSAGSSSFRRLDYFVFSYYFPTFIIRSASHHWFYLFNSFYVFCFEIGESFGLNQRLGRHLLKCSVYIQKSLVFEQVSVFFISSWLYLFLSSSKQPITRIFFIALSPFLLLLQLL